ncbi:MAG: DUF2971 domain-containing protein [Prolixibacteraceae bacterium]|nr:DUF2971 domain-containing protein [Prolixibacteraceae bacterium]
MGINENVIYKFFSADDCSLTNLSRNQIYCNHYSAFNDPFECWCIEKTGIPDPVREKDRYNSIVSAWGYDPGPNGADEVIDYCQEFNHEFSMRVTNYIESARFSCFCKRMDNILMWSHYADGLRGFCLEFSRNRLKENKAIDADIYDVIYQESPPMVDTMLYEVAKDQVWYHEMVIEEEDSYRRNLKNHVPDKLLPEYIKALSDARKLLFDLYVKMLCYKPVEWRYEEEIRLICHTNNTDGKGIKFKYPKTALTSIIIGEKISDKNKQILMSILQDNRINIPINVAKRDRDNYKIVFEPL